MSNDRQAKDKAMAAYLKSHKVKRHTGQCPWGCGYAIPNGGPMLLIHLGVCRGPNRQGVRKHG